MNFFRFAGDLFNLLAIFILLFKIWTSRSCAGISGKSQILFALVHTTRYLDLFRCYISIYNYVEKVVFICASYMILYLMYKKFEATHDDDTFRTEFIIPVYVLAHVVNHNSSPLEVLWTFSIYLESIAIFPQLLFIVKTGKAENNISDYLLCLTSYKSLYILNWVYRYISEGCYDLIEIVPGVLQTVGLLYCTLVYLNITEDKLQNSSNDNPHIYTISKDVPHQEDIEKTSYNHVERRSSPGSAKKASATLEKKFSPKNAFTILIHKAKSKIKNLPVDGNSTMNFNSTPLISPLLETHIENDAQNVSTTTSSTVSESNATVASNLTKVSDMSSLTTSSTATPVNSAETLFSNALGTKPSNIY